MHAVYYFGFLVVTGKCGLQLTMHATMRECHSSCNLVLNIALRSGHATTCGAVQVVMAGGMWRVGSRYDDPGDDPWVMYVAYIAGLVRDLSRVLPDGDGDDGHVPVKLTDRCFVHHQHPTPSSAATLHYLGRVDLDQTEDVPMPSHPVVAGYRPIDITRASATRRRTNRRVRPPVNSGWPSRCRSSPLPHTNRRLSHTNVVRRPLTSRMPYPLPPPARHPPAAEPTMVVLGPLQGGFHLHPGGGQRYQPAPSSPAPTADTDEPS